MMEEPRAGTPIVAGAVIITGAAVLAVVAIAIVAVGPVAAVLIVIGGVLVFGAPGCALVMAVAPAGSLTPLDVVVAAVGTSVALTILTGIVLSLAGISLTPASWFLGLLLLTLVLAALAWVRRGAPRALPGRGAGAWRRAVASIRPVEAGLVAVALLLAITAVGVARLGAADQPTAGFTQLWLIPRGAGAVEVGLRNEEAVSTRYRVVLETPASGVLGEWSPEVGPGTTWNQVVQLASVPSTGLRAQLYLATAPTQLYRSVTLLPPGPSPSASAP